MKIKQGFVLSKIGNDTVAVATGELSREFSGVVVLNGSGVFLWNQLQNDVTRDQLLAAMLEAYEVPEATAAADIDAFLAKLEQSGAIEE